MVAPLSIGILTDRNSWMYQYDLVLQERLRALGCCVNIVFHHDDIPCGDILFLLSYFLRVPEEFLARNTHNIVLHSSRLPEGRGWSPATWQILEGRTRIPATLFEATSEIDSGQIYMRDEVVLDGDELLEEWRDKIARKDIEMCYEFVVNYPEILVRAEQPVGDRTFYRRRRPADSELDIHKTLEEQFPLLQVVDNNDYPAFFYRNGRKYIIKIFSDDVKKS